MEIIFPDGRKATVINQVNDKMVTIRFEDGRETMWPIDKLPKEKEGEDTLKLVKVPALQRLQEFRNELEYLTDTEDWLSRLPKIVERKVAEELFDESVKEFQSKWGLT